MDKPAISIEPAQPNDAPDILALQRLAYQREAELYDDFAIAPLAETVADLERELVRSCVLKAVTDGTLVGSVRGHREGSVCHVARLMVHPDWQGQGIGAALMLAIEAEFPGVERFALFTGHRSEGNLRLYARLGYREVRQEPVHTGLSFVHMEKVRG